jgi:hypothetical protein
MSASSLVVLVFMNLFFLDENRGLFGALRLMRFSYGPGTELSYPSLRLAAARSMNLCIESIKTYHEKHHVPANHLRH